MQEKKRIPLKRLHRLRTARKQAAETDDLTPMMKAIKAVHSVTSTGSTQPEDLERQRAAQELFGRLVTPNLLINTHAHHRQQCFGGVGADEPGA